MIKIEIDGKTWECDRLEVKLPNESERFFSYRGDRIMVSGYDYVDSEKICLITDPKPEQSEWERFRNRCNPSRRSACVLVYRYEACEEADCRLWWLKEFMK